MGLTDCLLKSHRAESNRGPTDYESVALPAKLRWQLNQQNEIKNFLSECQGDLFSQSGAHDLQYGIGRQVDGYCKIKVE